jgi:hypothetical protein
MSLSITSTCHAQVDKTTNMSRNNNAEFFKAAATTLIKIKEYLLTNEEAFAHINPAEANELKQKIYTTAKAFANYARDHEALFNNSRCLIEIEEGVHHLEHLKDLEKEKDYSIFFRMF